MDNIEITGRFQCPICMSDNTVPLDRTEGEQQEFILDCEVCCAPVQLKVTLTENGVSQVEANAA